MSDAPKQLRQYLSQLVLSIPEDKFETPSPVIEAFSSFDQIVKKIISGESSQIIADKDVQLLLHSGNTLEILKTFPTKGLGDVLSSYVDAVIANYETHFESNVAHIHLQLLAIALLQTFVQNNFTGPPADYSSAEVLFNGLDANKVQYESIRILSVDGNTAYDLVSEPLLLILASLIFEKLMGAPTLISRNRADSIDNYYEYHMDAVRNLNNDPVKASLFWWRSRLLQVHSSILSDSPSILTTSSSILLDAAVPNALAPASDNNAGIQRSIQLAFLLESARVGIHNQTEHLAIPFLNKAKQISDLKLVLTGAKAKRTKYQQFHTSSLIVLAKSGQSSILDTSEGNSNPENLELNSDYLLEKPEFEGLDDLDIDDNELGRKRIKVDSFESLDYEVDESEEKMLPIAFRQENIPEDLKTIDPNDQPSLTSIDSAQLLLRLTTLRQTTPARDALVDEELLALVNRILFTSADKNKVNWTVFSRALWERSVLETGRSKTVERGILQMTSLIEEVGIKIKSRIIPQAGNELPISSRLRFVHQLTLLPQWKMDSKLAEKYMEMGVLRSAIDIYERLQLSCETALCYAAVGEESTALKVLEDRITTHPEDARAISIIGDIKQDPSYWEKAWEIGTYSKAKASLAKYYYAPPMESGLTKNILLAIKHMNECLTVNPLNFENWYFYGCCGLESGQLELAAEAFTRCVSIDDSSSHAWSNLGSALLKQDKIRPAFNAIKKAIRTSGDGKKSWKIYDNYTTVAAKLSEWNDVLIGVRETIELRKASEGELAIDIPIIEKLVEILVSTEYVEGERLQYFQSKCIDLVCNFLPTVITTSARTWRIVSKVEMWRKRPWAALECYEKAYRACAHRPELEFDEQVWNDAVDACAELVSAYENFGELPGKHDAGDVVCKDWKYKSRSTIRSLLSSGKATWEDSEGWERLQELKSEL